MSNNTAPFGWTVVRKPGSPEGEFFVYKRDCPADAAHWADDFAPFTHPSKAKAIAAGKAGNYAYKGR